MPSSLPRDRARVSPQPTTRERSVPLRGNFIFPAAPNNGDASFANPWHLRHDVLDFVRRTISPGVDDDVFQAAGDVHIVFCG